MRRRSETLFRTGIVVAWVGVAFGLAAYLSGDEAADLVMAAEKAQAKTLDPIVGEHDASAGWALGSAVLVAAAGVWGWRRKGLGREVTVPLLVLTALSTAILARTALLGGRIPPSRGPCRVRRSSGTRAAMTRQAVRTHRPSRLFGRGAHGFGRGVTGSRRSV